MKVSPNADSCFFSETPVRFLLTPNPNIENSTIDLDSLEIYLWDSRTKQSLGTSKPSRWIDSSIPYEFPEVISYISASDGIHPPTKSNKNWGHLLNTEGKAQSGYLVWSHPQTTEETYYAIYYKTLKKNKRLNKKTHQAFLGDGYYLATDVSHNSINLDSSRVTVVDWNQDGLSDLIVGGLFGYLLYLPNLGTKEKPNFLTTELLTTEDGTPIDVGWSAAPLAIDWNFDQKIDLLVGAEQNRILYFENRGTQKEAKLKARGFLKDDSNQIIELPFAPVPEAPNIYNYDYHPLLEVTDWNGDGKQDLLAGGYVTGRLYFFENIAKTGTESPLLQFRGPINTMDGKPLKFGWALSPTVFDFDEDGDLDLIAGQIPMTPTGGDSNSQEKFLGYFENRGTRKNPKLMQKKFPATGGFPFSNLSTPRIADLNHDGLMDLVVSARDYLYLYLNIGTKKKPLFEVHQNPIPNLGGPKAMPSFGLQWLDWNNDGILDIYSRFALYVNKGHHVYERFDFTQKIEHPNPKGDSWEFTQLADLDFDQKPDLLFGTYDGTIYFHKNTSLNPTDIAPQFEVTGVSLKLKNGEPLKVGPTNLSPKDFDAFQGARTQFAAADLNCDQKTDLAVMDTYGKLRYFVNSGTPQNPQFLAGIEIGDLEIRGNPVAADWDGDGFTDIVASSQGGKLLFFKNTACNGFLKGAPISMPNLPYPIVYVTDWNQDQIPDLVVASQNFFIWFERSFLERGYLEVKEIQGSLK